MSSRRIRPGTARAPRWRPSDRRLRRIPGEAAATAVAILALLAAGCSTAAPASDAARRANPRSGAFGPADTCRRTPSFTGSLHLAAGAQIGTSFRGVMGLAIQDPGTGRLTQDASWDDAGYLGPFTYDRDGNIYTAPVPLVSLLDNPPSEQNKVYRVDSDSGAMRMWAGLAPAEAPSAANPFGIVALAYDCDTNSLYAASLMGSTPEREVGRVFQIDVPSAGVADVLEGTDFMGVGVYTGVAGKRLYLGRAREASVSSVALDASGGFGGAARHEFYLADLGGGRDERVQRITFDAEQQMLLKAIPFRYTLRGALDVASTSYALRYVPAADTWETVSIGRR